MPDRAKNPQFTIPKPFPIQKPETRYLSNGIPLHLLHFEGLPLLKIDFVFAAGKWFEAKNGCALITAHMLREGTIHHTSEEISKQLERLGAFIDIQSAADYTTLSLYCLNEQVLSALQMVGDMIHHSNFPTHELVLLTKRQAQQVSVNEQKNAYIASNLFKLQLFGSAHPYGQKLDKESLLNLDREEVVNHYRTHIAGNYEVIVTGNVSQQLVVEMNELFGECSATRNGAEGVQNEKIFTAPMHIVEDKKDSVQTSLRVGWRTINERHEDYYTVLLLNEVLGGYFGSRLMQNLREDKGITYGVHSSLVHFKHASYWQIGTDVKKSDRDMAIEEINREILRLQTVKMNDNELDKVRNYFKGNYLSDFTSPFAHADKFRKLHFHQLPDNFYNELFSKLDEVTTSDLLTAANRYISADKVTVLVG
jgi:predicted Zn-dependent peptidase